MRPMGPMGPICSRRSDNRGKSPQPGVSRRKKHIPAAVMRCDAVVGQKKQKKTKKPLDFYFCRGKLQLKHPGGIAVGAVMRDYGWFNSNTGCFIYFSPNRQYIALGRSNCQSVQVLISRWDLSRPIYWKFGQYPHL